MNSRSLRRKTALLVLLGLGAGGLVWKGMLGLPKAASSAIGSATKNGARTGSKSAAVKSAPSDTGETRATRATPAAEVFRTIAENSRPGRMVFLDLDLDGEGVRLVGAEGAAGRAKPRALRAEFGFVQYEVFDLAGRLTLAGSVEDPTRRRIEYPAASGDGRIESTVEFSEAGKLSVRLPGESAPARIVFHRVRNPGVAGPAGREVLADIRLRASL